MILGARGHLRGDQRRRLDLQRRPRGTSGRGAGRTRETSIVSQAIELHEEMSGELHSRKLGIKTIH